MLSTKISGVERAGSFDWGLVPERMATAIVLSGGLTADNVAGAIRRTRPYAVDVSSSVETSKGIKDRRKSGFYRSG